MMPFYLLLVAADAVVRGRSGRLIVACAVGFLMPMLLFLLWARAHPEIVNTILGRDSVTTGQPATSLLDSARYLAHYLVLQARLSLSWKCFDPSLLFLTGSPDPALGTRSAGIFLVAAGLLIAAGIYDVVNRFDIRRALVLAGFASAPLAPVIIDTGNAVQREMVLLPFGALLAAYGARRLLRTGEAPIRWLTTIALIALPLQFAYFAHDYFGDYQLRAADRIDPINMGEIARTMLQHDQQPPLSRIYLSESLDDGLARWHFFVARYRREDLLPLTWGARAVRQKSLERRRSSINAIRGQRHPNRQHVFPQRGRSGHWRAVGRWKVLQRGQNRSRRERRTFVGNPAKAQIVSRGKVPGIPWTFASTTKP
jgi:hypothetical protein